MTASPYDPQRDGQLQAEFTEQWRDAAYGCFSSGHKFCREVCPVMQVTRNENHTPTAFHANVVAMDKGHLLDRRRRRGLRPLHPVRRVRAALSRTRCSPATSTGTGPRR